MNKIRLFISILTLIFSTSICYATPSGVDELILNSANGNIAEVQNLLQQKTDPNGRNDVGMTPLISALQGRQLVSVELLLKAGSDPNLALPTGQSPLYFALPTNLLTRELIRSGAYLDEFADARAIKLQKTTYVGDLILLRNQPNLSTEHSSLVRLNSEAFQLAQDASWDIPTQTPLTALGYPITSLPQTENFDQALWQVRLVTPWSAARYGYFQSHEGRDFSPQSQQNLQDYQDFAYLWLAPTPQAEKKIPDLFIQLNNTVYSPLPIHSDLLKTWSSLDGALFAFPLDLFQAGQPLTLIYSDLNNERQTVELPVGTFRGMR